MGVAALRPHPIPVYAEMSSINPFFLFPHALASRGDAIATAFAGSMTMGVGQFCTNPGLVLGVAGPDFDRFAATAAKAIESIEAATMLTAGIATAYQRGVRKLGDHGAVEALKEACHTEGKGSAALFRTTGKAFMLDPALHEEMFGPASLLVACDSIDQMRAITEGLEGQLTATLQMDDGDAEQARALLPVLERKVGRILANGMPTGVEVSTAMVHGGPFPATSDGRSSSVGTAAIARFLRPVCYQNLPQALLPEALRDENGQKIWRRRDGALTQE